MQIQTQQIKKMRGRPVGSIAQFPGIATLSRLVNRSQCHLNQVFLGERELSADLKAAILATKHPLAKQLSKIPKKKVA